ncbi:hypothetical protein OHS70_04875 [Streptomyces sp. NBC_00390]|uniref:hypothetical protein n=1 Tax=Streptomyces sp. NBC_00390 TaxID=2975736 RepID=UPI002E1B065B
MATRVPHGRAAAEVVVHGHRPALSRHGIAATSSANAARASRVRSRWSRFHRDSNALHT